MMALILISIFCDDCKNTDVDDLNEDTDGDGDDLEDDGDGIDG